MSFKTEQSHYQTIDVANRNREVVGSRACNLEYLSHVTDEEIRDDIVSYLGEYRFKLQKFDYKLALVKDSDGKVDLCDPHRLESMSIKSKRAIEERKAAGLPTHREEAEETGISHLKDQLRFARIGDRIFWASPPGPKSEGYGNYGFLYSGKVSQINFNTQGKAQYLDIDMTAIRVENPSIAEFNQAMSALTGIKFDNRVADEFLEQPVVTRRSVKDREVDSVICQNFDLSADQREKFDQVIAGLESQLLIDDLIKIIRTGSREERIKAFYTLENYALKLKSETALNEKVLYLNDYKKRKSLQELAVYYSYRPPIAFGSCGSTDSSNSLIGLGSPNVLSTLVFGPSSERKILACKCPSCERQVNAVIENGKITCPKCSASADYNC
ncbi:hypothetical protein C4577_01185 [Candidatus Parcubacteria bacterium]|nr:MAG: hypothetical protein C4577_01185 [Candidatus Parcubacteria bacterium]